MGRGAGWVSPGGVHPKGTCSASLHCVVTPPYERASPCPWPPLGGGCRRSRLGERKRALRLSLRQRFALPPPSQREARGRTGSSAPTKGLPPCPWPPLGGGCRRSRLGERKRALRLSLRQRFALPPPSQREARGRTGSSAPTKGLPPCPWPPLGGGCRRSRLGERKRALRLSLRQRFALPPPSQREARPRLRARRAACTPPHGLPFT